MNSGCFDSEFKDILISVQAINRSGKVLTIPAEEIIFAYRSCNLAKEREEADQRVTVNPKIFTIRYRSEVTTKHRISYDGDIYHITGITEIGRKEGQRITAVAREND